MDALGIVHVGAFLAAGLLLNLTPGPDLLYASTQAGSHGAGQAAHARATASTSPARPNARRVSHHAAARSS